MQPLYCGRGANQPAAASSLLFVLVVSFASILTGCGAVPSTAAKETPPASNPVTSTEPAPAPPPSSSPVTPAVPASELLKGSVNHIIFLLQENRSFDHYFGHLNDYRVAQGLPAEIDGMPAGASNPTWDGKSSISAFHLNTMCVENPTPSWDEAHHQWNQQDPTSSTPAMDGFVHTAARFAMDNGLHDTAGRRAVGYYTAEDLPIYYFLATQFATSDRWFAPVMTRTQPNRMFLMAGDSAGHVFPRRHDSPDPGEDHLRGVGRRRNFVEDLCRQ